MTQPDLFRSWGEDTGTQPELFEQDGHGRESCLSCSVCGEPMVETPSGYLCCPRGHGGLLPVGREDKVGLFEGDDT